MKKSLIALLLSSTFFLTGFSNEQLAQKLLEAEQKIVQLEAELAQLAKAQPTLPALQPEIIEVFSKSSVVKHEKDPNNPYAPTETHISIFASTAKTGFDWIDNKLLLAIIDPQSPSITDINAPLFTKAQRFFEYFFQELENSTEHNKVNLLAYSYLIHYVGQRKNIATFQRKNYYYAASHGLYTEYFNFDLNKKSLITLDDLFDQDNQSKVHNLLWNLYDRQRVNQDGELINEGELVTEADFFISDQFYFTKDGIKFVYSTVPLAAHTEEVELLLHFEEVNELLNPEYQLTKKDGFGLDPTK